MEELVMETTRGDDNPEGAKRWRSGDREKR